MANDTATATYSNDPENVAIDLFRLRVGDTDCRDANLTDAEIRYFLAAESGSSLLAAAAGARAIAAKMAKKMDSKAGAISKTSSQLRKNFVELAEELEREATIAGVVPEVLGRTVAEKQTADQDTGAVQPDFAKGVHDNPRSGPTTRSSPEPTEVW